MGVSPNGLYDWHANGEKGQTVFAGNDVQTHTIFRLFQREKCRILMACSKDCELREMAQVGRTVEDGFAPMSSMPNHVKVCE